MTIIGRRRKTAIVACLVLFVILILIYAGIPDAIHRHGAHHFNRLREPPRHANVPGILRNPLTFPHHKLDGPQTTFITEQTFFAMWTTVDRIWTHVPLQLRVTLSRFPHSAVYSDNAAIIGNTEIIDIVSTLDASELIERPELESYRWRRKGIDENWGWEFNKGETPDKNAILELIQPRILEHIEANAPKDMNWFILADESTYVSVEALTELLRDTNPEIPTVFAWGSEGQGGPNILWSRSAFADVLRLERPNEIRIHSGNISSTTLTKTDWCEPLVFFHDLAPWEIQTLYDRDVSGQQCIFYSDFYRDLILPFVKIERNNWEISPSGPVYTEVYSADLEPHTKMRHCKRLCEMNDECLSWQWRESTECRLESNMTLRRGAAKNSHLTGWTEGTPQVNTGWMVDRIRAMRSHHSCDPLGIAKASSHEESNDDEHSIEGWVFKAQDRAKLEQSDVLQALEQYKDQS